MLQEFLKSVVQVSTLATPTGSGGPISFTSVANIFLFHPVAPIRLFKWGLIATTSIVSGAAAGQFSLRLRPTVGSAAGDSLVDTLTTGTTTYAAGTGVYRDPWNVSVLSTSPPSQIGSAGPEGDQGTFALASAPNQLVLLPGQEYAINVVTAPDTSGAGYVFLEYTLLPIARPSGYAAGTISSTGDTSLTDNLTRLAS